MTIVSIPAKAMPAGVMLVIVGEGACGSLGSYNPMLSGFVQLPSARRRSTARRSDRVKV
jgi:hypothetical protein